MCVCIYIHRGVDPLVAQESAGSLRMFGALYTMMINMYLCKHPFLKCKDINELYHKILTAAGGENKSRSWLKSPFSLLARCAIYYTYNDTIYAYIYVYIYVYIYIYIHT